jgi:hypothetical protein
MVRNNYKAHEVGLLFSQDLILVEFKNMFCHCPNCKDEDAKFVCELFNHVQPWCL